MSKRDVTIIRDICIAFWAIVTGIYTTMMVIQQIFLWINPPQW